MSASECPSTSPSEPTPHPAPRCLKSSNENNEEPTVRSVLTRLHKALQSDTPNAVKLSVLIGQLYDLNEQGHLKANLETTPDFIQIMEKIREKQIAGKLRTFVVPKPDAVVDCESMEIPEKADTDVAMICPPIKRVKIEEGSDECKQEGMNVNENRKEKEDDNDIRSAFLRKLVGCHCTQKIIWRLHGHKRRTMSLLDLINFSRERTILNFAFGELCKERVKILTESAKTQKRSLAFCGTILYGLALMEAREKLEKDPTLTKKKRLNAFSNLQRRDRYGSFCGRLRESFMERTGLGDRSEMSEFERVCDVTVLLFDSAGFLSYISPKLRSQTAWFLLDEKTSDLYLVTNPRGLCRVDLPNEKKA